MKAFNKILLAVLAAIALIFAASNWLLLRTEENVGRPYLVDVNRLVLKIEAGTYEPADLQMCDYVTAVSTYRDDFYDSYSDYVIRDIGGTLYRFDYSHNSGADRTGLIITVNCILAAMSVLILGVLYYIKWMILSPFDKLKDTPYALSKGNLTAPIKETKNRFFGRFIWGLDLLRENMEQQKERELELQRDRKVLLLSLSHDIKTPLSPPLSCIPKPCPRVFIPTRKSRMRSPRASMPKPTRSRAMSIRSYPHRERIFSVWMCTWVSSICPP